jgi:serine/threonine-protein kinase RsbW
MGLLGEELPRLSGIDLFPVYRPGAATLEVGGDWYDAFALPDGRIALVVGDVVGHGLDAAITMGQLRGAVRALAPLGGPADLLVRLDEFAETIRGADSATLAYAELEPSTGRLRYACAGHPPPFLLRSERGSEFLWSGRSTPVAAALFQTRDEATVQLAPGDTIGLYTDGLVERRGQSLEDRFERLLATSAASAGEPLERLSSLILDEMLRGEATDDDACLLLVRASGPGFTRTIASDPAQLAVLRRALRAWLEEAGVGEADRQEVLLAIGEALTNAIEHAYASSSGEVRLDARLTAPDELVLTVRDHGRWLDRPSHPDRGRGLRVMQAVVDELDLSPGADGTTVELRKRLRAEAG